MTRQTLSNSASNSSENARPAPTNVRRLAIGVVAALLILASVAWLFIGVRPAPTFETDPKLLLALQACQKAVGELGHADLAVTIAGDGASLAVRGDVPTKADVEKVKEAVAKSAGTTPVTFEVGSAR